MACTDCTDGWDHCHDVLIDHADGSAECAGGGLCVAIPERHGWVVACAELVPPCACAAVVEAVA